MKLAKLSIKSQKSLTENILVPVRATFAIKPGPKQPLPAGLETIRIEGHPFWRSKKRGSGPQLFVFQRADALKH